MRNDPSDDQTSRLPTLTTTSFAILGLLHRRSMSASELAAVMQHSAIAAFWPRARSKLYEEPKKLVAHGLAEAEPAPAGRHRTIYAITDDGEAALRDWVRRPSAPPELEAEIALRVSFADTVEPSDLLAALAASSDLAIDSLAAHREAIADWLDSGFRFPEHAHVSALVATLPVFTRLAVRDWSRWVAKQVLAWEDMDASDDKQAWANDVYRALLAGLDSAASAIGHDHLEAPMVTPADLPDFSPADD